MVTNASQNISTAVTGKILQGAGIGNALTYSTATYPSTATGTGKILRADGTNFVATTATYPDTAGTSGNVLTSDGTNWSSTAPSATAGFTQWIGVGSAATIADSTTYYFVMGATVTDFTLSSYVPARFVCANTCTITKAYGVFDVGGTGSAENATLFLRKNDTTNTNISTTVQLNASTVTVSNTGLSISLSPGDYLVWGFTTPVWATNPTAVAFSGSFST